MPVQTLELLESATGTTSRSGDSSLKQTEQALQNSTSDRTFRDDDELRNGRWTTHERHVRSRQLWEPFFLRRTSMAAFILSFIAVLIALIALYCYSSRANESEGIKTEAWKYYYLWTYGPTAVFMLLGACWTQVEYRGCQLMPWLLMSRAPTAPSDGVLLDYVSPWNVVSLYTSLKRSHFLVTLVIAGTLLVHGLAVVSTGLFELRPVSVKRSALLQRTQTFAFDNFDPQKVPTIPYMRADAIRFHDLQPPVGTSANHAFQPFQDQDLVDNTNSTLHDKEEIEAEVDVLTVNVECENATLDVPRMESEARSLWMKSDSCAYGPLPERATNEVVRDPDGCTKISLSSCDGNHFYNDTLTNNTFESADWRLWAFTSRRDPGGQYVNASKQAGQFAFTSVLCTPYYEMSRRPVKISRRSSSGGIVSSEVGMEKQPPLHPISNITPGHILYAAYVSFNDMAANGTELLIPPSGGIESLFNISFLSRELGQAFESISVQVAKDRLLQPEESMIEGTSTMTENRLFVRRLSFGLMVGVLAILIKISALLFYLYLPLAVCCRDPSSIGGLATILARSPELMTSFRDMNLKWPSEIEALLSEQKHSSKLPSGGAYFLEVHNKGSAMAQKAPNDRDWPCWWRPISATPSVYILTLALPVAIIITIEVLLHISTTKGGLAQVEGRSNDRHQPWVYIPALVMFGVRCFFQAMEFNARVFQPFHCLYQGKASARASLLENQHRKVALWAALDSLRKRQWTLAASAVALLLAAVLPIIVSGLYTVESLPFYTDISLTHQNDLDIGTYQKLVSNYSLGSPATKGVFGGRVIYLNSSYPQWTCEDLTFSKVALSDPDDNLTSGQNYGYIETELPAWRANLNCTEVQRGEYEASWTVVGEQSEVRMNVTGVGETCSFSASLDIMTVPGLYFSKWGRVNEREDIRGDNPADCPTVVYAFGKREDMNVLKCRPQIEEVDVDVRLQLPSLALDPNHPPSVIPGSVRAPSNDNTSNEHGTAVGPPWTPGQGNFASAFMSVELGNDKIQDPFTLAVLNGKNAIPASELLLDSNKLSEALSWTYGVVVSQILNSECRQAAASTTSNSPDTPTFAARRVGAHDYLIQKPISTRLLDAFLGCMVLLGILSTVLMSTKAILPKNPCSIAAVASLLVGSRMMESIPPGAEWWDNAELQKRGVFTNQTFTMGWWTRKTARHMASSGSLSSETAVEGEGRERLVDEKVFGIDVDYESDVISLSH